MNDLQVDIVVVKYFFWNNQCQVKGSLNRENLKKTEGHKQIEFTHVDKFYLIRLQKAFHVILNFNNGPLIHRRRGAGGYGFFGFCLLLLEFSKLFFLNPIQRTIQGRRTVTS